MIVSFWSVEVERSFSLETLIAYELHRPFVMNIRPQYL